jgi:hypothetical protein
MKTQHKSQRLFSTSNQQLNKLLNTAADHAETDVVGSGHVSPFFIGSCPGGVFVVGSPGLGDANVKQEFAAFIRFICQVRGANAGVLALEAWITRARPGEDPASVRPSLHPDRRETVVLLGETTTESPCQVFLPIMRDAERRFTHFGSPELSASSQIRGSLAGFLPPPELAFAAVPTQALEDLIRRHFASRPCTGTFYYLDLRPENVE